MKSSFWDEWKNISEIERSAIKALKVGKKLILQSLPKKEIVAIYVKGSFIRREMNEKSDVDMVTIVCHSAFLKNLKRLDKKYATFFKPTLQFRGYSLQELKTGKRTGTVFKMSPSPSRFVKHLPHYKCIYGKPLKPTNFFMRSNEHDLRWMIQGFNDLFLPRYKEKKFGFSEVIKQVFWLVENEERFKGHNPPHSWKGLAKSIKDKNHIVHDAFRFRVHPTQDKRKKATFIRKLQAHLNSLERLLKRS